MFTAADGTVVLEYESTVVSADDGVWCDRCLLPSATRITLVITEKNSPTHIAQRFEIVRCEDEGVDRWTRLA